MEAKTAPIIHEKDCKYISVGFQIVEAPKIKPIKIDSPENKDFKTREKLIKKSNWVLREDIDHLSMYMFDFDDKDKNKTIKNVSELILNGGKKLQEALEKARPITEWP